MSVPTLALPRRFPAVGTLMSGSSGRYCPASMTPIRNGDAFLDVGGAERRFATTKPAVPPPRIRTSNSREAKSAAESVEAGAEVEAMGRATRTERRTMRDSIALYEAMATLRTCDYTGQDRF